MGSIINIMNKNSLNIYDLHCHVLPEMDDGCSTVDESFQIMCESTRQGIAGIMATPHYYPNEAVSDFILRRHASYQKLMEKVRMEEAEVPILNLGAEVAYYQGIVYEEHLEQLCFGKSRYLLLELPFSKWSGSVLRDIQMLINTRNIKVIIAHLERFLKIQDKKVIRQLLDMDVQIQMNAGYVLDFQTKRRAANMIADGSVLVLGSDSHNMGRRPQNLGYAYDRLVKMGQSDMAEEIRRTGSEIFWKSVFGERVLKSVKGA